jgi:hypothetical protein
MTAPDYRTGEAAGQEPPDECLICRGDLDQQDRCATHGDLDRQLAELQDEQTERRLARRLEREDA